MRDYGLHDRQFASTQQHELTLAIDVEGVYLAIGADLVDTGGGAQIRGKYQAFFKSDREAVGHKCRAILNTRARKVVWKAVRQSASVCECVIAVGLSV